MGSDPGRLAGPESGREDAFALVDHTVAKRGQLVVAGKEDLEVLDSTAPPCVCQYPANDLGPLADHSCQPTKPCLHSRHCAWPAVLNGARLDICPQRSLKARGRSQQAGKTDPSLRPPPTVPMAAYSYLPSPRAAARSRPEGLTPLRGPLHNASRRSAAASSRPSKRWP
jgi:hypothetical protein